MSGCGTPHWSTALPANACCDALAWAQTQESATAAWATCERGDWMLWILDKLCRSGEQHKRIVLAARGCARLALKYVLKDKERHLNGTICECGGRGICLDIA